MKIAAAIIGVLVVAVVGVWFFVLRAPSAEAVCGHLQDIAKKELGESAGKLMKLNECVESANREADMKGAAFVAKTRKCILNASTLDGVVQCGK